MSTRSASGAASTQLDQIIARTSLTLSERKASADTAALERKAMAHTPRGFAAFLRRQSASRPQPAVIAELKKASPSKGVIREVFHPAELARSLEAAGAATLSVLTDEAFFQGSLENLEIASATVKIPCLRKDFMIDPFQMLEARAAHADAILLIVAVLSDEQLLTLCQAARALQLDVLCEVHSAEELDRALQLHSAAPVQMIGVNSRDLRTFVMNPQIQFDLAPRIPSDVVRIAESGIRTRADIDRLTGAGYDAFLVGETLMRQPDPAQALTLLLDGDRTDRADHTAAVAAE
ncbi:MAG TPA: indole-3-glycerol phosphate synthase TrpC [Granulicella sp.]|nr:indole-3-glycerol phosphate synthase TrpC [Granulicella sp.]